MALDLSPKSLVGPTEEVRLNLTNEDEISIQGIFLYFCYIIIISFYFFHKAKKCLFLLFLENISMCTFPDKSSLNL